MFFCKKGNRFYFDSYNVITFMEMIIGNNFYQKIGIEMK